MIKDNPMKAVMPLYNDSIDIQQLIKSIGRGKWLIMLSALLGLVLAFLFAFSQAPTYKADVLLQVTSDQAKLPGIDLFAGESSAEAELKLITSRNNLSKVVKSLRLNISAKPKRVPVLGNLYKNLLNQEGLEKPSFSWAEKYAWGNENIKVDSFIIPREEEDQELTIVSKPDNKFVLLSKDRKVILEGTVGEVAKINTQSDKSNGSKSNSEEAVQTTPQEDSKKSAQTNSLYNLDVDSELDGGHNAINEIINELKEVSEDPLEIEPLEVETPKRVIKKKEPKIRKVVKNKPQDKNVYTLFISELRGKPGTEFSIRRWSELSIIDDLKKRIEATEDGIKTGIFSLGLEGRDKQVLVAILDQITGNYLKQTKFRNSEDVTKTLYSLEGQLFSLKKKSDAAEERLRRYRTENQTADMSVETQAALEIIADIDTELQRLSQKKDEVGQKFTSSHPTIRAIESQEDKLQTRKSEALLKVSELPKTQQNLLKLEKEFSVANEVYINLLNNIQQIKIAKASSGEGNIHLIDSAAAHNKPVKPNKKMILVLGPLLGALLAMLYILMSRIFNHMIENPDKLEEALGIPVYANIPLPYKVGLTGMIKGSASHQESLLDVDDDFSPAIESLRYLRSNLHVMIPAAQNNRIMLTAPTHKVGRFFVSSNLATVIAEGGSKVLLIDADLREGTLHELLNKNLSPGLSELINDEVKLEDVVHSTDVGNGSLDIITRGKTPTNPSKLFLRQSFESLLSKVSKDYDLVLIDSPPIESASDATVIGKQIGTVFMVLHTSMHSMKEIDKAVKKLSLSGINTSAFIFND